MVSLWCRASGQRWRGTVPSGPEHRASLDTRCLLNLVLLITGASGSLVVIVTSVCVLAPGTDLGAVLPEQERDAAAGQGHEEEDHAGPLVAAAGVHLLREEHDGGAPEAADEGLGREGGRRLVLVRVDEVVVGGVVQEDEAEPDPEAAEGRAEPVQARV